ncbi:hypothetical protein SynPROSU1_02230 [Synechococcus sp. PROS-U-1]|nr:hypothetical protein SynPROSU1_02230 [Synechococcus sp. PROS-U-1]
MDLRVNLIGLCDQRNPRFWSLGIQACISSVIDGGRLRPDCSLHGWIGFDPEASSLACWGGELQALVKPSDVQRHWK